ncbi:MAG: ligase-associated DNA damage response DEXH box helicase [Cyclobacteriaceae bacterium]
MALTKGEKVITDWIAENGWQLADFQRDTMAAYLAGKSGLLNAPTGSGKTYALFLPILADFINKNPDYKNQKKSKLRILWITPLRALTKDIQRNLINACTGMSIPWKIGIRTGDMSAKEKNEQIKEAPEVLLITPESLHLFFAQKGHEEMFRNLEAIVVDEWHELLSTKRGVATELGLAHMRTLNPHLLVWGISATIGNLEQALQTLIGTQFDPQRAVIIRSTIVKKVEVESILPDHIEKLPWAGYLGINLLDKVMPIIMKSKTTLLFTNTRSQTEIWFRFVSENYPELAGQVALHHGSLDREIRAWVEENLHLGKLKLVICTSSLDLGVDFRPVETVIQVGSAKSISRFLQRAGRSGHRPGATSKIYFVPTHAIELIEGVCLRDGVKQNKIEERIPIVQAFDVLVQYMVTLAVGGGFKEDELFHEIKSTYSYQFINTEEWQWLLGFITTGGATLDAYDEFSKVDREGDLYVVKNKRVAMRHRLSMGTIVSDASLKVQYVSGKYIGNVEESFIARMNPGDVFSFAGMNLEFIRVREMTAHVRKASSKKKGIIPRWAGGRIPLSSQLSEFIRERLSGSGYDLREPELATLQPLLDLQRERSDIPDKNQLLIEQCRTKEGYHIFIYPFEGRLVHEGMAALIAYRVSKIRPITFSMAMNDYGFELLTDTEILLEDLLQEHALFSTEDLLLDIQRSVNSTEMAKRKFREVAAISGMIFQGYPGQGIKARHLQASSSLLFDVISEHEPKNLLIRQAYQEALDQQLEERRLRMALERIRTQDVIIRYPTTPSPFAFPIMVDRLREQLSSEKLEDRLSKLVRQFEQVNGAKDKK